MSETNPRSQARLAAVQALYQMKMSDDNPPELVVEEFLGHRLGQEIDGERYGDADAEFFADIVKGVAAERADIDAQIESALNEGWSVGRLENIMLAVLRAGVYELRARPDVPSAVVINEYMDVAHAFYEGGETGFVNGILDTLAKTLRA